MQGTSGSFAVNGVTLLLQPTSGHWVPKTPLGIGGDGHAIYPGVREFELRFNVTNPEDINQLQTMFSAIQNTGTAVVDLPKYNVTPYQFYSYSGCVLREPEQAEYFNQHHTDVYLLITNIRT